MTEGRVQIDKFERQAFEGSRNQSSLTPDPIDIGAVAQLGEHLLCKQGVGGSIPLSSTKYRK